MTLVASVAPCDAFADPCGGTWGLNQNTEYAVVGTRNGHVAVCQRLYNGTQLFFEDAGCDTSTPSGDLFRLSDAGGGDDTTVAPLDHTITCAGSTTMHAWSTDFDFGLYYTGYDADDYIYGTPNADELYSNFYYTYMFDYNDDLICAYGGDDTIGGDVDAPSYSRDETCLDGGAGSDTCIDGDMTSACETQLYYVASVGSCPCGSAPPTIWVW